MIIESLEHARYVVSDFVKRPWIAIDTETESTTSRKKDALVIRRMDITMFSFCYCGVAYSVPVQRFSPEYPSMAEYSRIFKPFFTGYYNKLKKRRVKPLLVMHNANYDVNVFLLYELKVARFWDTMIAAWLVNPDVDKSLKAHAPYLGLHQDETKTIDFNNKQQLARYAEQDVIITDELYQVERTGKAVRPDKLIYINSHGKRVSNKNPFPIKLVELPQYEVNDFHRLFLQLQEYPVLKATIRAEQRGLPIDRKRLQKGYGKLLIEKGQLERKITKIAGRQFNINSTEQLAQVLIELGIPLTEKTPTGKWKLNKEALHSLTGQHVIIDYIKERSAYSKLESTYMAPDKGMPTFIQDDGRIRCNLNTVGAVTGRYSSSNPNLQNIPSIKDIFGIKSCFRAPKGKKMICLDFGQIEIRVMALFSKDKEMTRVLCDPNQDMHTNTSNQFGVARDPVAKFCNFNIQYGGGAFMLAKILTLAGAPTSQSQAKEYITSYNTVYHGVIEFREQMYAFHRKHGYFPYLTGRKRTVQNLDSDNYRDRHKAETQLINNVIQGSAQDLLKAAIIRTDPLCINMDKLALSKFTFDDQEHKCILKYYAKRVQKLRDLFSMSGLEWLLQVHDEVLYLVDESAAEEVAWGIAEIMTWRHPFEPVIDYTVPIICDGGIGDSWGDAKKKPEIEVTSKDRVFKNSAFNIGVK